MNASKWVVFSFRLAILLLLISCSKDSEHIAPNIKGDYRVFAWNDLGMHCLNPTYDKVVILPPYNNLMVQVVKRGNPPQIITEGIFVEYKIKNNTTSADKRDYGQFWTNAVDLFGPIFGISNLPIDQGLTGNGLSGEMALDNDHFIASGIPVTPVDDNGKWDPYQVAEVTVMDNNQNILITTEATIPTSDEINCAKCHGDNPFDDILAKHDASTGTDLVSNTPVLCASCHGSPALGQFTPGSSGKYLSEAIHGFHADKDATCYDCHPGATTKCSRSLRHTATDGNCIECHGDLTQVASSIAGGRIPWAEEPKCVTCHTNVSGVDTGNELYRNARGHGSLYCTTCHGSPHAMYPSSVASDNYQPLQYQSVGNSVKTIGSCGICHQNSRGEGSGGEFGETHGGKNPKVQNACHVCHTEIPENTTNWPHAYQWKNSN